jgi:hypothetical protein
MVMQTQLRCSVIAVLSRTERDYALDATVLARLGESALQNKHAKEELASLVALMLVLEDRGPQAARVIRRWLENTPGARKVLAQLAPPRVLSFRRETPRLLDPPPPCAIPVASFLDPLTRVPRRVS